MYADDIILLSLSVSLLQELISIVEETLAFLDMYINAKKSNSIRFGPRYDVTCTALMLRDGSIIPSMNECIHLGKLLLCSTFFKCDFENEKKHHIDRLMVFLAKLVVLRQQKSLFNC